MINKILKPFYYSIIIYVIRFYFTNYLNYYINITFIKYWL